MFSSFAKFFSKMKPSQKEMGCMAPNTGFPLEGIDTVVVPSLLMGNKSVCVMGEGFCQKELCAKKELNVGVWSDAPSLSISILGLMFSFEIQVRIVKWSGQLPSLAYSLLPAFFAHISFLLAFPCSGSA